jgi:hypothetical protein
MMARKGTPIAMRRTNTKPSQTHHMARHYKSPTRDVTTYNEHTGVSKDTIRLVGNTWAFPGEPWVECDVMAGTWYAALYYTNGKEIRAFKFLN